MTCATASIIGLTLSLFSFLKILHSSIFRSNTYFELPLILTNYFSICFSLFCEGSLVEQILKLFGVYHISKFLVQKSSSVVDTHHCEYFSIYSSLQGVIRFDQ